MRNQIEPYRVRPWPYSIICVFSEDEHKQVCSSYGLDFPWPTSVAQCNFFRRESAPRALGVACFVDSPIDYPTFSHEAVHIISDIMHYTGWKYDPMNDEPYAYVLEDLIYEMRHQHELFLQSEADAVRTAEQQVNTIATYNHEVLNRA